MAAAVVELDALADTVGAAAKNENFLRISGRHFIVPVVGGVHVRGLRLELRGARVDALHGRAHILPDARLAHLTLSDLERARNLDVAETAALHFQPVLLVKVRHAGEALQPVLGLEQVFHLAKVPRVEVCELADVLRGHAGHERLVDGDDARGVRDGERLLQGLGVREHLAVLGVESPAVQASLQGAKSLVEGLLPRAADSHRLADGLHLRRQDGFGPGELLEREAGDLGDDVVDGGLERRRGLQGDIVGDTIERAADGELGGHLSDGEAGRLGGERG